eukprot:1180450-Ditylum_brightwellii.AAC.1
MAYRCLAHVYRLGSCPRDFGRNSHEGWTWRFYLPNHLQFRASNSLLEHIMAIITPSIDVISGRSKRGVCLLSMIDSSTLEGWLKKSNFSEPKDDKIQATIRLEICRSHTMCMVNNGTKDYSQWLLAKITMAPMPYLKMMIGAMRNLHKC